MVFEHFTDVWFYKKSGNLQLQTSITMDRVSTGCTGLGLNRTGMDGTGWVVGWMVLADGTEDDREPS